MLKTHNKNERPPVGEPLTEEETIIYQDELYRKSLNDFRYNGGSDPDSPPRKSSGPYCVCGCRTPLGYRQDVVYTKIGAALVGH